MAFWKSQNYGDSKKISGFEKFGKGNGRMNRRGNRIFLG
jgi:hypothetical protein